MEINSDTLNILPLPAAGKEREEALIQCPTCSEKLKPYEVANHYDKEMERLKQMQTKGSTIREGNVVAEGRQPWTVYQRVQRNRKTRLKQRAQKRPTPPPPSAKNHACPVCNIRFHRNEIHRHAEQCLQQANGTETTNGTDDHSSNDEDGGEEYEEYEWAGQKRIRVSSLLQGGYAAIGIGQTIVNNNVAQQDDDEEDLNVDEDDTHLYGPSQYGERDIIIGENNTDTEGDVTSYMRSLITETPNSSTAGVSNNIKPTLPCDNNNTTSIPNVESSDPKTSTTPPNGSTSNQHEKIIEALKDKLRIYENCVHSKFKCLICLDDYKNPAISVSCWHVHCEECWLRSLGARKLCPQCNLITTPKDLRRIYL